MKDIIIVGGGPAGLTSAIYAARAGKTVKVYEKEGLGGQILYSPMVDNYPGIPHMSGARYTDNLVTQIEELGVEFGIDEVTGIEVVPSGKNVEWSGGKGEEGLFQNNGEEGFLVKVGNKADFCKAVILATGVAHRKLGLEKEEDLIGCGVSYCAVCDGAFYKDAEVAVIGGGDTALQDAVFLASTAKHVTIIHRRDDFRGEKSLVKRIIANPKIDVLYSHVTEELIEENGVLTGLKVKDIKSGGSSVLPVEGAFLAVGQIPQSEPFKDLVDVDRQGYYYVGEDALTNVPGIFAAGDARIKGVRQLTTAVGDGAVAAVAACNYIDA